MKRAAKIVRDLYCRRSNGEGGQHEWSDLSTDEIEDDIYDELMGINKT